MALSLFTAPLNLMTALDVHAFLDLDLEEGPRIDYKAADNTIKTEIPETVFKAIIAFANTAGGLIIVGVESDKKKNRPGKRTGIMLKPNLEEAITSKCLSSILPPVIPEVTVCPFKSDPTLPTVDRAFIIIRVSPSNTAPHSDTQNYIHTRTNSECQLADLPRIRYLFNRQGEHEALIEQQSTALLDGDRAIHQRFGAEYQDSTSLTAQRWAINSHRIYLEFLPIDSPGNLLPFGYMSTGVDSLDAQIVKRLKAAGWYIRDDKPDDIVPLPDGLGVVTPYRNDLSLSRAENVEKLETAPVTIVYIAQSGGMVVNFAPLSFGYANPKKASRTFVVPLLMQLATLSKILWQLLQEHEYSGRVQVTIWVDSRNGYPAEQLRTEGHRGRAILSVLNSWEEQAQHYALIVSQMTRSYSGYPFGLTQWDEGAEPQLED